MKLSIIIPCYNEAETIGEIVRQVQTVALPASWQREVIIVDDGSSVETKKAITQIVENASAESVRVITRTENGGKGAALKNGFAVASGEYLMIQDADLEYMPTDIPALLAEINNGKAQVVFGSRNLAHNNVPGRFFYYWGGRAVTIFFNICFGTHFSDLTTCYKVFPRSLVPDLLKQPSDDFVFDAIELSSVLAKEKVVEVPISYKPRDEQHGKKLKASDGIRCLLRIITLHFGKYARVIRFILVGGSAAIVNIAVLYVLTQEFKVWYLLSEGAAFVVALCYNFLLQKFWTFDRPKTLQRGGAALQGFWFVLINIINLALNTALLYVLVEFFGIWYILAQFITSLIIAFESYFLYKIIFR